MTAIHHEVHAACPAERVWALLADLEAVQRSNPGVRRAAIERPQRTGAGARRSCDLVPRGQLTATLDTVFASRVRHAESGAPAPRAEGSN
jgi:Polyketide cyclase / dehydrase and lipid transport